jgi:hypothetical protein
MNSTVWPQYGPMSYATDAAAGELTPSPSGAFNYVTYKVRLSPETERGMYDMSSETPTRTASTGFVLPSNDEWVKAAYYDPNHGGTDSYWLYPTGPFDQPNISVLDPATGDVTNADRQPPGHLQPERPLEQRGHAGRAGPERRRPGVRRRPGRTAPRSSAPSSHRGSTSRRSTWGT